MSDLRGELRAIYDRHGELTPKLVVQEARPESHPLHNRFEWDDSVAGERWREQQAHELIRTVRVTYREASDAGPEKTVRGFHAIKRESGYVYEPAEKVAANPVLTELVLMDMRREWQALQARYGHFQEFAEMVMGDLNNDAA